MNIPNVQLANLLDRLRQSFVDHTPLFITHKTAKLAEGTHVDAIAGGIDRPDFCITRQAVGFPIRPIELKQTFVIGKVHPAFMVLNDLPILVSGPVLLP